MNILFDFSPLQNKTNNGVGGAASFTYSVLMSVLGQLDSESHMFALVDGRYQSGKAYDIYTLSKKYGITLLNAYQKSVASLTVQYSIDTFFAPIGQFLADYDLTGLKCRTVMFIHDIFDIERSDTFTDAVLYGPNTSTLNYAKRLVNLVSGRWKRQANALYSKIMPLFASDNTIAYTVSEYSRNALRYYFPELRTKDIRVCYSPLKEVVKPGKAESDILASLIEGRNPYLLVLAAGRRYKNANVVLKVFSRLVADNPGLKLLTLGYGKSVHPNHIDIPFLSNNDLELAYSSATALVFGSFFEGFGYPPIEAMRYLTPSVVSNVTSIPEISGDAVLYFSPSYPADLYRSLSLLLKDPHCLDAKMEERLLSVTSRQKSDLARLVDQIINVE